MADISSEITAFQTAVYGEEVRSSMVSLAEKVNTEVETGSDNITNYTSMINTKMTDLGNSQSEINVKIDAVEQSQIECNRINSEAIQSAKDSELSSKDSKNYSNNSSNSAKEAKSWAIGSTNSRSEEDINNAKYYCLVAKASANESKDAIDECKAFVAQAQAETAGYRFWVEDTGTNAGYLFVDTSASAQKFLIDEDGYLYVEVN